MTALQWHHTQPFVCTASVDRNLRLWDARSGVCLLTLTGHRNIITQFHMAPLLLPLPLSEGTTSSSSDSNPNPNPPQPPTVSGADSGATDVIVTVSDDGTAKVFHINMPLLMQ